METIKELKNKIKKAMNELDNKYMEMEEIVNDEHKLKELTNEIKKINPYGKIEEIKTKYLLVIKTAISESLTYNPYETFNIIKDFIKDVEEIKKTTVPYLKYGDFSNTVDFDHIESYYDLYFEYNYFKLMNNEEFDNHKKRVKAKIVSSYLNIDMFNLNCNIVDKMLEEKIDINTAIELMKPCNI